MISAVIMPRGGFCPSSSVSAGESEGGEGVKWKVQAIISPFFLPKHTNISGPTVGKHNTLTKLQS